MKYEKDNLYYDTSEDYYTTHTTGITTRERGGMEGMVSGLWLSIDSRQKFPQ